MEPEIAAGKFAWIKYNDEWWVGWQGLGGNWYIPGCDYCIEPEAIGPAVTPGKGTFGDGSQEVDQGRSEKS